MPQLTPIERNVPCPQGNATITLVCLFQIVTGCCIFFACLRVSVVLAVLGTIIATPAIIRTGMASEIHQTQGLRFGWNRRLWCFAESIGVVLLTATVSSVIFVLISLIFGLLSVLVVIVVGPRDLINDVALIGTLGGMAWGAAGAIVAIGLCARIWRPKLREFGQDQELNTPTDILAS